MAINLENILESILDSDGFAMQPLLEHIAGEVESMFEYDVNDTSLEDVCEYLESVDCSGGISGLIYTGDLADKLKSWNEAITRCLASYYDATGENWTPAMMRGTEGDHNSYVWFAYEWSCHEVASHLRWVHERGKLDLEIEEDAEEDDECTIAGHQSNLGFTGEY